MSSLTIARPGHCDGVNAISSHIWYIHICAHVDRTHIPGRVPCHAVYTPNMHRADGESQGNISFSTSRKIRAGPVVIAPSRGAALFAQTTAEPLNGGPGLGQKPERTTGGEERRSGGLPQSLCVWIYSVCVCVRSVAGTPSLTP